jgi:hypothetical protein
MLGRVPIPERSGQHRTSDAWPDRRRARREAELAARAIGATRLLCAIDAPGARRNDRDARNDVRRPLLRRFLGRDAGIA